MMERKAKVVRETKETKILVELNLDGQGRGDIRTGIGFFDHLLTALCKHASFDLTVQADGDLHVDGHHTVEDAGIVIGQAFAQAVGDGRGITRFGHAFCPLDESLARAVVDVSGRPFFHFDCDRTFGMIGDFDGELFEEFMRAFSGHARLTVHLSLLYGKNQHHILEAMIKSLARALRMAVAPDARQRSDIPSTKGVL